MLCCILVQCRYNNKSHFDNIITLLSVAMMQFYFLFCCDSLPPVPHTKCTKVQQQNCSIRSATVNFCQFSMHIIVYPVSCMHSRVNQLLVSVCLCIIMAELCNQMFCVLSLCISDRWSTTLPSYFYTVKERSIVSHTQAVHNDQHIQKHNKTATQSCFYNGGDCPQNKLDFQIVHEPSLLLLLLLKSIKYIHLNLACCPLKIFLVVWTHYDNISVRIHTCNLQQHPHFLNLEVCYNIIQPKSKLCGHMCRY